MTFLLQQQPQEQRHEQQQKQQQQQQQQQEGYVSVHCMRCREEVRRSLPGAKLVTEIGPDFDSDPTNCTPTLLLLLLLLLLLPVLQLIGDLSVSSSIRGERDRCPWVAGPVVGATVALHAGVAVAGICTVAIDDDDDDDK